MVEFAVQDLLDLLASRDPQEIPELRDLLDFKEPPDGQDGLVNQEDQAVKDLPVSRVRQTLLLAYYECLHIGYMKCRKHIT